MILHVIKTEAIDNFFIDLQLNIIFMILHVIVK